MSDILNETKADKEVIKSLLREIKRLKERFKMSVQGKILFDINGDVYRATEFQQLSEDDLNRELTEARNDASEVEKAIAYSNGLQAEAQAPATPTEPIVNTPVAEAPAAPVENLVPAPAPEAPVEQSAPAPATPEVPAPEVPTTSDPATAPAPVAPIVL